MKLNSFAGAVMVKQNG